MCTSGIMYVEEDEYEKPDERVCEYSGLLSVEQYQYIDDDRED